mgnify:CR=1 FL=1
MYNGPNIGIYAKVNDDFTFLPNGITEAKSKQLSEYLQTDVIVTSVATTSLIGILTVINNHGILLPNTASEDEFATLKSKTDLNIEVLDVKQNALGNMMIVNDNGAENITKFLIGSKNNIFKN